jgi:GrpB-like predicted nucleotidyltransferase (UPF0157 family)
LNPGAVGEPIVISEYDPRWPALFCELRDALPAGLRMCARSIEHVGSTAVPGLAAKPIIDIDVVVADEADVAEAIAMLAAAGYPHKGDAGVPGREAFDQPPHLPEHHLYLCVEGAGPLVAHLRLRDHLRANPGTAREYAALKRELTAAYGDDREGYTEAKTVFIERVLAGG